MIYMHSQHNLKGRVQSVGPLYLQVSYLQIQLKVDGKQYLGSMGGTLRFGICGYEGMTVFIVLCHFI